MGGLTGIEMGGLASKHQAAQVVRLKGVEHTEPHLKLAIGRARGAAHHQGIGPLGSPLPKQCGIYRRIFRQGGVLRPHWQKTEAAGAAKVSLHDLKHRIGQRPVLRIDGK